MKSIIWGFFLDGKKSGNYGKIDKRKIIEGLKEAVAKERLNVPGEINIIIAGDKKIRELNRQYRGVDRATDVLSFNYGEDGNNQDDIGEIYININYLKKESRRLDRPLEKLLVKRIVHGVVHLAGFDHENDHEAEEMEQIEKAIISRMK